ncbi:MAG: hypothetical protein JNK82_39865 [Myxococcaceae bacterium]|nr:hypothetical protein [Myxococcaceae bacterium]
MGLIVKPLASKHHAEIQRITDTACERFPELAAIDSALADATRDDVADCAFAWAKLVMALGGWGWWSVSYDGRLNPALVSWNKAWFVVPLDCVIARQATTMFERIRALPPGDAGAMKNVLRERA